jgi:hypothetical protein
MSLEEPGGCGLAITEDQGGSRTIDTRPVDRPALIILR